MRLHDSIDIAAPSPPRSSWRIQQPILFALVLAAAVGYSGPARSELVTFAFTAKIYDIKLNTNNIPDLIDAEVHGNIIYNTSVASPGPIYTTDWKDYLLGGPAEINVVVAGTKYSDPLKLASVVDDRYTPLPMYYLDRLYLQSGDWASGGDWMQFWVDGADRTTPSALISSTDLPVDALDLSLADLGASPFILNTADLQISAWVTSMVETQNKVAEPSSLALASIALLVCTIRRSTMLSLRRFVGRISTQRHRRQLLIL